MLPRVCMTMLAAWIPSNVISLAGSKHRHQSCSATRSGVSLPTVSRDTWRSWGDADAIRPRSPRVADQLERAVDSIGINIAEGYGRLHGRERARFYEFALGSAREAREWYARAGRSLAPDAVLGRAKLLTRAVKILTAVIPRERAGSSEKRMRDASLRALEGGPWPSAAPRSSNEP